MSEGLAATIVVATHNRAAVLDLTLPFFLAQRLERGDYEVIVADDGSTDDTPAIVARHACQRLVYLPGPKRNLAAARNRALRVARGEVLLFADDDAFVGPGYVAAHLGAHRLAGRGPAARPAIVAGPIVDVDVVPAEFPALSRWTGYHRHPFPGCNSSVRRADAERVGGFDEAFDRYGWEDTEFAERCLRAGLARRFAWGGAILHYKPRVAHADRRRLLEVGQDLGRMGALFYRKHPSLRVGLVTKMWWPFHALDRALARTLGLDATMARLLSDVESTVSPLRWSLVRAHAEIAAGREWLKNPALGARRSAQPQDASTADRRGPSAEGRAPSVGRARTP